MGLQLELLSDELPPIRTAVEVIAATTAQPAADGGDDCAVDDDGCATPTSAANMLRAPSMCPPAPRKPRLLAKKRTKHYCTRYRCSGTAPARWFIAVPHDLAAAFVARRPASTGGSPDRPPAGKKIRVHVVG